MNRRKFLKGLVAITGIPAVVAGVAKAVKPRRYYGGDERDLPFELPSMAKPRRFIPNPAQKKILDEMRRTKGMAATEVAPRLKRAGLTVKDVEMIRDCLEEQCQSDWVFV